MGGPNKTGWRKSLPRDDLPGTRSSGSIGPERATWPKEDRPPADVPVVLLVAKLSEAFADLWPALASDLRIQVQQVTDADSFSPPTGAAALVLAAGGAEQEA